MNIIFLFLYICVVILALFEVSNGLQCLDPGNVCNSNNICMISPDHRKGLDGHCKSSCTSKSIQHIGTSFVTHTTHHHTCKGDVRDTCCCSLQSCVDMVLNHAGTPTLLQQPIRCPICHGGDCHETKPCYSTCKINLRNSHKRDYDDDDHRYHVQFESECVMNTCIDSATTKCCTTSNCVQDAVDSFSVQGEPKCPIFTRNRISGLDHGIHHHKDSYIDPETYVFTCPSGVCGFYVDHAHHYATCDFRTVSDCYHHIKDNGICCTSNECVYNYMNTISISLHHKNYIITASPPTTSTTPVPTSSTTRLTTPVTTSSTIETTTIRSTTTVTTTQTPTTKSTFQCFDCQDYFSHNCSRHDVQCSGVCMVRPSNNVLEIRCIDGDICIAQKSTDFLFQGSNETTCCLDYACVRHVIVQKALHFLHLVKPTTTSSTKNPATMITSKPVPTNMHHTTPTTQKATSTLETTTSTTQTTTISPTTITSTTQKSTTIIPTTQPSTTVPTTTLSTTTVSPTLTTTNKYHFTPPVVCEDNDPNGYCVDKDRICSATDYVGMMFAYSVCPKTCKLCHDYGECPTCSGQVALSVCHENKTKCDSSHVGCFMTLAANGVHAGCAVRTQTCEDQNHFLCSYHPIPFPQAPMLLCNYCCQDANSSCFQNITKLYTADKNTNGILVGPDVAK